MSTAYPTMSIQGSGSYYTRGGSLAVNKVTDAWREGQDTVEPQAAPFLVTVLGAEERFEATRPQPRTNLLESHPSQYLHVLQVSTDALSSLQEEVEAAFGRHLTLEDRWSQTVALRVSDASPPDDPDALREFVAGAALLPEAGDGIRSFVGTMLAALCGSQPILLIDEPESFLHPPQIRRLARSVSALARDARRQVIFATHSLDVIDGALKSGARVGFVRLSREGAVNRAQALQPDDVRHLLERPMLRSLKVMDGLFHEGVVVCESDSDARFYEAMSDRVDRSFGEARADLFFAPAYGKGELKVVAGAYERIGVRCVVIADIDLFDNVRDVIDVIESLDEDLRDDELKLLTASVHEVAGFLSDIPWKHSITELATQLDAAASSLREDNQISDDLRREITRILREAQPRSQAKLSGLAALSGEQLRKARQLFTLLEAHGLFVVPRGELERWWPEGPQNNKLAWFGKCVELLERSDEDDWPNELREALEFVRRVREYLRTTTSSAGES